jgi:hypothetical protein
MSVSGSSDWSSDVCSSDLPAGNNPSGQVRGVKAHHKVWLFNWY